MTTCNVNTLTINSSDQPLPSGKKAPSMRRIVQNTTTTIAQNCYGENLHTIPSEHRQAQEILQSKAPRPTVTVWLRYRACLRLFQDLLDRMLLLLRRPHCHKELVTLCSWFLGEEYPCSVGRSMLPICLGLLKAMERPQRMMLVSSHKSPRLRTTNRE